MSDRDLTAAAAPAEGKFGRYLDACLGGCAAVILFCLMILTLVDVVGRDLFDAPLPGGFEITELMMAALIFTVLPVVSWREEHVTIDLLDALYRPRGARLRQVAVNIVSATAMGVLAWRTWALAVQLQGYNEITEFLQIPVWPIIYLMAVMSGIATLAIVINVFRYLTGRLNARASGVS